MRAFLGKVCVSRGVVIEVELLSAWLPRDFAMAFFANHHGSTLETMALVVFVTIPANLVCAKINSTTRFVGFLVTCVACKNGVFSLFIPACKAVVEPLLSPGN